MFELYDFRKCNIIIVIIAAWLKKIKFVNSHIDKLYLVRFGKIYLVLNNWKF